MLTKIFDIYGKVLFEADVDGPTEPLRLRLAVVDAVKKGVDLCHANLVNINLANTDLHGALLAKANLESANLYDSNLYGSNLTRSNLCSANLTNANLYSANLTNANLYSANLTYANLYFANLTNANLYFANLTNAVLNGSNLTGTKNLVKTIGFTPGNCYWKRFDAGLSNNGYQFKVGLNLLREGEVFNSDERKLCAYPGFHFASRSWCATYFPERPLEARIRIPEDAQINEPWATDGKASADKIEILQVFEVATGKDVTDEYR